MAVITISRQFGAGGRTLGDRLSRRLGYRYVHEDMIKEIAIKAKVSDRQIRDFEKRGTTKLLKFLDKIVSVSYVERLTSDSYGYVDEGRYVDAVKDVVEDLYARGNVVIIGRASQFILKDRKDVWHILLVGDLENRIRFLMDNYYLEKAAAEKAIRRADHIRSRFLSFFAEEKLHDNPLSYDMVINVNRVGLVEAEELIVDLISGGGS